MKSYIREKDYARISASGGYVPRRQIDGRTRPLTPEPPSRSTTQPVRARQAAPSPEAQPAASAAVVPANKRFPSPAVTSSSDPSTSQRTDAGPPIAREASSVKSSVDRRPRRIAVMRPGSRCPLDLAASKRKASKRKQDEAESSQTAAAKRPFSQNGEVDSTRK
ncbi:hypothetical protein OC844_006226, partial [Tilletia horrida]